MRKRLGLGPSGIKTDVLGAIEQTTRHATVGGVEHIDNVAPMARDRSTTAFGAFLPAAAAPDQLQDSVKEKGKAEVMEEDEEL